jgi:hypothetical protein
VIVMTGKLFMCCSIGVVDSKKIMLDFWEDRLPGCV